MISPRRSRDDISPRTEHVKIHGDETNGAWDNAMTALFSHDQRSANAPLFSLGSTFTREAVVIILKARLRAANLPEAKYNDHSFRKGAAQHAHDCGLPKGQIMELGQ